MKEPRTQPTNQPTNQPPTPPAGGCPPASTRRGILGKASLALCGLPLAMGAASPGTIAGRATINGLDARMIMLAPGETLSSDDHARPHVILPMDHGYRLVVVSHGIGDALADRLDVADGVRVLAGLSAMDRGGIERDGLAGLVPG